MSTLAPPAAPAAPSALNGRNGRTPSAPARRATAASRPAGVELALGLASFFALAVFCAAHYSVLVADASGKRVVGLAVAATAGGALLALTAHRPRHRLARIPLRIAIALATLVAALVVTGLSARLLLPAHWSDLRDGLDRGFAGLNSFEWPYAGGDPWVRLTLLLGMPLLVAPAAVLAFWPAGRAGGALRWCALALLLVAYGTGVTELGLGGWAVRGAALLVVVAAWLWLPRLRPKDTVPAALAVLACGLAALPLAASFHSGQPWLDYRHWDWFARPQAGTSFNWNHSYGPIQWSRSGVTLLAVKSSQPHYWKAETLDRFDGVRWSHSLPAYQHGNAADDIPTRMNPRWVEHISFTVRKLETSLVVGAGTTFHVQSDKVTADEADGTIRVLDSPFAEGDTYSIDSYVPDPTASQMRLASRRFPTHLLGYTAFELPGAGGVGASAPGQAMPRGEQQRVLHSPYAQTYRLARRLAAGQPTTYDTVKAVEKHLQSGFQYSEKPPVRRYPLASFLFHDKIGYCQQFSGAMALLLRMDGIPARVAGGFAPGAFDHVAKEYRVRDLDAHSWVEVWFSGIGWVPFDPTPSLSPASSQSSSLNAASAARGTSADHGATGVNKKLGADIVTGTGGGAGLSGSGSKMWLFALAVVVLVPLALVILWLMAVVRRRPHFHGAAQGAVDELRAALRRLGYDYPARTTLAELERRLRVTAGPGAARYVGLLRDQRFARPGSAAEPTARDRRELRRALTDGGGPLARLRGLLALPPHPRAG